MIERNEIICPYCGEAADYIDSKDYYRNGIPTG